MLLKEKDRRAREQKRSGPAIYQPGIVRKGRRARLYVVLLVLLVALGGTGYLSWGFLDDSDDTPSEQQQVADEQRTTEEVATEEGEAGVAIPDDPTLYLTIPKLGIYGHTVRDDDSEEALSLGAAKVPGTGFPWQNGDTNTYIACHRLGFPGTESYNQCLNLPSMQQGDEVILTDANGTIYEYRVSEALSVSPEDIWATEPVAGREVVSLQTCIEAPGDFSTLGPNWGARFVILADRVG